MPDQTQALRNWRVTRRPVPLRTASFATDELNCGERAAQRVSASVWPDCGPGHYIGFHAPAAVPLVPWKKTAGALGCLRAGIVAAAAVGTEAYFECLEWVCRVLSVASNWCSTLRTLASRAALVAPARASCYRHCARQDWVGLVGPTNR